MLITYHNETSGTALGGNEPLSRSHMREGASRNSAIQLRAVSSIRHGPAVAQSRSEETTVHRYSPGSEADAAFRERIARRVFGFILGILFLTPLILAGIAVKFG